MSSRAGSGDCYATYPHVFICAANVAASLDHDRKASAHSQVLDGRQHCVLVEHVCGTSLIGDSLL